MRLTDAIEVARAATGSAADGEAVQVPAEVVRSLIQAAEDYRLLQAWRAGVRRMETAKKEAA